MKLLPKMEVMEAIEEDTDAQYDNTVVSSTIEYINCGTCRDTGWVLHENGTDWLHCRCQYSQ
jgi:hypothetical protein